MRGGSDGGKEGAGAIG